MNDIVHVITWEAARVGGLVAYVLAAASVCLGLLLSLKVRSPAWPRFVTDGAHRYVTLLSLAFTGIHTVAVWLDPFTAFEPAEVLVPFASHYRPLWIALGIVAAYLLLAVWASERIRPHVGYRWWRRFHFVSFAVFVLGTLHGIGTGRDTATWWGVATYAVAVGTAVALLAWRLWVGAASRFRIPSVAALGTLTVALAGWMAVAPLQPGWNAIANNGNGDGQRNPPSGPSIVRLVSEGAAHQAWEAGDDEQEYEVDADEGQGAERDGIPARDGSSDHEDDDEDDD